ncbi:MAG: hypothetical protein NC489_23080 [Ruminococcus flavefaciens]|nr:hypothetical protein [Ruminococcus flavefaciens]
MQRDVPLNPMATLAIKPAPLHDWSDKVNLAEYEYSVTVEGENVYVKAEDLPLHANSEGTEGAWVGLALRHAVDGTESTYKVYRHGELLSEDAKTSETVIDGEMYDTVYFEGQKAVKNGPYVIEVIRNDEVYAMFTVHFNVSVYQEQEPEFPVDPGMATFGFLGYVTLDEADSYVMEHYMSTETQRVCWEALEDADRAALLRRAFQTIELLPFTGHKTDPSQPTAFPRCPSTEVPLAIKFAQIEQALIGADEDANTDAKQYQKMLQWGIASYRIGNLSESMHEGGAGGGIAGATGIISATASRLLAPFMQGGYNIR